MRLPDDQDIRALHEKYAPTLEAFESVYTHCTIVRDIADQLLARGGNGLDAEMVRAGSLLHDIGVYLLYTPSGELDHERYVSHGHLGHRLLAEEGFPEELCRFCSHHTGVGIGCDDIRSQGLPMPLGDYFAESAEEELVMYADKFHSKSAPPSFVSAETFTRSVGRFGADKAARFMEMRDRFGEPDLAPLMASYGHALR
ncbi:HDIG domain-containing metalloprotein [Nocardiopsis halophila]|uniref:HDIG domain-containing metalloprotein n=1 Tax=Nocardiopsis halophila TaxID=141692 RepID=UPI000346686D|nr:HDIG domain-containing metalloprotein [Nocardiopsis halophila]